MAVFFLWNYDCFQASKNTQKQNKISPYILYIKLQVLWLYDL